MKTPSSTSSTRSAKARNYLSLAFIFIALSAGQAIAADDCGQPNKNAAQPFRIFDATLYAKKPDLSKAGFSAIAVIDRGIWPPGAGRDTAPDPALVKNVVQKIADEKAPIVLDFEDYPLTGDDAVIKKSLSKLGKILDAFKAAAPERQIGFYGTVPLRDYWRAVDGVGKPKYALWQSDNNKIRVLEEKSSVLFPSLYTFYDDKAGWVKYATAQICEARRMSRKPVYVFLWPEYHDSNKKLGGNQIDAEFWKIQLQTARKLADGIVIWGGYDMANRKPREWDESAAWWVATKELLSQVIAPSKSR